MPARWEGDQEREREDRLFNPVPWLVLMLVLGWGGLGALWAAERWEKKQGRPEASLPAVHAQPTCDWMGPYPTTDTSLELWVVVCPEGEGGRQ